MHLLVLEFGEQWWNIKWSIFQLVLKLNAFSPFSSHLFLDFLLAIFVCRKQGLNKWFVRKARVLGVDELEWKLSVWHSAAKVALLTLKASLKDATWRQWQHCANTEAGVDSTWMKSWLYCVTYFTGLYLLWLIFISSGFLWPPILSMGNWDNVQVCLHVLAYTQHLTLLIISIASNT